MFDTVHFSTVVRGHVGLIDFASEDDPSAPRLTEALDAAKAAFQAFEDFREAMEIFGASMESLTEAYEDAPMDDPDCTDLQEWVEIFQDLGDTWALAKERK